MISKEEFLQCMATIYDNMQSIANEVPEYIRHNLKMSIVDNDLRLCYLIVDKKTCDRIAKWVDHYDKGQKA